MKDELGSHLRGLTDHLRARTAPPGLAEVAAVTEVLLGTMQAYFRSLDTELYREFRNLSDYIARARDEIAELRPGDLQTERLPRAGRELEAIVRSTEEATNRIMSAAEAIMAADHADPEAFRALVADRCMAIFEACSFQDITGQRITKVVETLTYIEQRVGRLNDALGAEFDESVPVDSREGDARLLNGPALEGEGVAQDEVDRLLDEPPAAPAGKASQADIDAMFG